MADMHAPHVHGGKIGKHSIWLWGGVITGVVILYVFYSRSSGSSAAPATTTSDGSLAGDTGSGSALPVSSGGSGSSGGVDATGGTSTDGSSVDPTTDPTTDGLTDPGFPDTPDNFGWEASAVKYLIGHGVSGINAQQAIEKYLNGDTLTYQQATWLNGAIAANGIAPEGVMNTPTYQGKPKPHVATPKPKPKPKPTHKPTPVKHHPAHTTTHHPVQTKHTTTHQSAKGKAKPKVTIKRKRK